MITVGNKKGQSGFTLLEVMMVLVIALLIMAGVFTLISTVMGSSKTKDAQQNIAAMRVGIQNIYSGEHNYSGLDNDVARKSGIVPDKLFDSNSGNSDIVNGWNGEVTIKEHSNPSMFQIIYEEVPQEACIKLSTLTGYYEIEANGSVVESTSDAVGSCSGESNEVTFTSR